MESASPPPPALTLEEALKLIESGKTNLKRMGLGTGAEAIVDMREILMHSANVELWFGGEAVGVCAMNALTVVLPHSNIRMLHLDAGRVLAPNVTNMETQIKKLAAVLPMTQIRHLKLEEMFLGEDGAAALAAALPATRITTLSLDYCFGQHADTPFEILMQSALSPHTKLKKLHIKNSCRTPFIVDTITELLPQARRLKNLSLPFWPVPDGHLVGWPPDFLHAVGRSTLKNLCVSTGGHVGFANPKAQACKALARAEYNRRILAFVSGFFENGKRDETALADFLRRDGDLALQHRVAWFLVE